VFPSMRDVRIRRLTGKFNDADTCILAFVPDYWDEPWQPRHYILSKLSEKYQVIWISRPFYWIDLFDHKSRPKRRKRLTRVSKSLCCYSPWIPADYVPPWQKSRMPAFVRRFYHRVWLSLQTLEIKNLLRNLKAKKVILYLWQPHYCEQIGRFHENMALYHIDDEYHYDSHQDNPISLEEKALLERSDAVFIHSRTLMQKKGNLNRRTFYLPNGVDYKLYRSIIEKPSPLPNDISRIPKPIIGYAGWIKKHLDLKLLLKIARARRDWSIVFVGPIRWTQPDIDDDIELLKKERNVFFLGNKNVRELPIYVNAMDVCLMPYRITSYTKYIYPLKLHEYLACGKPIVATRLPNLLEFQDVIYFADNAEDWEKKIEQALIEDRDKIRIKRTKIARKNSWDERIKVIVSIFEKA
jgi:glycosyltransferase involved in cell wall biosynthesis